MDKNRNIRIINRDGAWYHSAAACYLNTPEMEIRTPLRCRVEPLKKIQRATLVNVIPEDTSLPEFYATMNDLMFFNLVTSQLYSKGVYDGYIEKHLTKSKDNIKMSPQANKTLKEG